MSMKLRLVILGFVLASLSAITAGAAPVTGPLDREDFNAILTDLGRGPLPVDTANLRNFLKNRKVLVSGGAGSIGSEIVLQACKHQPLKLVSLDQSEFGTFMLQALVQKECPTAQFTAIVGSIRDRDFVDHVVKQHQIDTIYHAAAYKHVHLMEDAPYQAVKNNVEGTRNLLNVAAKYNISVFVNVSTDKAVHPSNVMGATKRINELLVRQMGEQTNQKFLSVRFGNVFGSSGSVGPIFERQIREGGPVTVTHKDMTRFMMSIPEAAQLVLVASTLPREKNGIFLLDMGTPIKVIDLAHTMIRRMGYEVKDIPIIFPGIRRGEKMHEILNTSFESLEPTPVARIRVVRDLEIAPNLTRGVDKLTAIKPSVSDTTIGNMIRDIIPDFYGLAQASLQLDEAMN